jgi:hypothetical protein
VKTVIDVSPVMDGLLRRIKGKSFGRLFLKYRIREVIKKKNGKLEAIIFLCVISGFCREVDENCALLRAIRQRVVVITY